MAEARAAGSTGHSCSPRDLPPGALGPDVGADPACCCLWERGLWRNSHTGVKKGTVGARGQVDTAGYGEAPGEAPGLQACF